MNNIETQEPQYTYFKRFYIARLQLSSTVTDVTITDNDIAIEQAKAVLFRPTQVLMDRHFKLKDIQRIKTKKSIDISHLIFGLIFFFLGVANPLFALFGLYLIWDGYGKNLFLTIDGIDVKVPTSNEKHLSTMIKELREKNTQIIVEA